MSHDLLDWIRTELQSQPTVLPLVEQVLNQARQTFGGETLYIRTPERVKVTRRTLQLRRQTRLNTV